MEAREVNSIGRRHLKILIAERDACARSCGVRCLEEPMEGLAPVSAPSPAFASSATASVAALDLAFQAAVKCNDADGIDAILQEQ